MKLDGVGAKPPLVDQWQDVPKVFGVARRLFDDIPGKGRYADPVAHLTQVRFDEWQKEHSPRPGETPIANGRR
ncbi:MAG: hypothetical protein FWD29_09315, partial [Micrococcales bacterium]|nr:hypothetical protein [Micrococcales bacterium]